VKQRIAAVAVTARDALPTGTGAVGTGLAIAAITSYVFVIMALNSLEGPSKAAFSAFWAVVFVAGPGFFLPLEQEVSRALAHRRAIGVGGKPLVQRASRLGALITLALVAIGLLATPLLTNELYHGERLFTLSLGVSLVAFFGTHLTRGVFAGEGRFRPYGELLAIDGIVRLLLAVALLIAGIDNAALFALCIGIAPLIALPISLRSQRGLLQPGPDAPYSELSANIGWLLTASILMQLLAYSPLLGINILATPADEAIVVGFASAFFVARVPVLLFQSVQGTLLPKLAGLAGEGKHDEFRRGLLKLLYIVVGIGVLGAFGSLIAGPFVGKILFKDFTMSASGLALLAAGSGVFIIALTLAQALIALGGLKMSASAWAVGVVIAMAIMSLDLGLELRVDLGFLFGSLASTVLIGIGLFRRQALMKTVGIEGLIEAIEQEPIEI
jgi:O-antigen/teichoic acid export membrane protein